MLLWIKQKQNKAKQTNKSTAIFHGLYSYRPQKWRQNVQNFAVELLVDITSRSRFFEKLQLKWTPKLSMLLWKNKTNKQINSNFPWSVLLSTTEMMSKCSKLCSATISRHIIWELPEPSFLCCSLVFWGAKSGCAWATFFDKRKQ